MKCRRKSVTFLKQAFALGQKWLVQCSECIYFVKDHFLYNQDVSVECVQVNNQMTFWKPIKRIHEMDSEVVFGGCLVWFH